MGTEMTKNTTTPKFRIFNICAFDPNRETWVVDRYLNDQDRAIAQAQELAKEHPDYWIWVKGHKNRKDTCGEFIWSSNKSE